MLLMLILIKKKQTNKPNPGRRKRRDKYFITNSIYKSQKKSDIEADQTINGPLINNCIYNGKQKIPSSIVSCQTLWQFF